MPLIDNNFVEDLKSRVNILDYIGRYVDLKVRGHTGLGLCPFHGEKSPSFNIDGAKGFYHCFGCKASGNIFKFVQEYFHLNFHQAILKITQDNNIDVVYAPSNSDYNHDLAKQKREYRDTLYQRLEEQTEFFIQNLLGSKGAAGRDYLASRGFDVNNQHHLDVLMHYQIGYAGPSSNLTKTKDPELLKQFVDADLIRANDYGGYYDSFTNRITFPIMDIAGHVLGFAGRTIDNHKAKYLNSSDSEVYNKSRVIYGFYQAIKFYRAKREKISSLLLVEGNLDVVSLAKNGIPNAIAASGTAFSSIQLNEIFKQTDNLICCFDADSAGKKAAMAVATLTITMGHIDKYVSFMFLDDGEDPDSYITKYGVEAFIEAQNNAINLIDYMSKSLIELAQTKDSVVSNQKRHFQNSYIRLMSQLNEDNFYLPTLKNEVVQITGMNLTLLDSQLEQQRKVHLAKLINRNNVSIHTNPTNTNKSNSYNSFTPNNRYDKTGNEMISKAFSTAEKVGEFSYQIPRLNSFLKSLIHLKPCHYLLYNKEFDLICQADVLFNKQSLSVTILKFIRSKLQQDYHLNENLEISQQLDLETLDLYPYIKEQEEFKEFITSVVENSNVELILENVPDNLVSFINKTKGLIKQFCTANSIPNLTSVKLVMLQKQLKKIEVELNKTKLVDKI